VRSEWAPFFRWLQRAHPPLRSVLAAVAAATFAAATGLALFVGAPYLLVFSSTHTKLVAGSTLAIALVVVELVAFLRSPLRFVERLTSHDLGLQSVTQWRRWLLSTVGSWSFSKWRSAANGDLLERAMADTDALQDLWIRCVVPIVSLTLAMLGADFYVAQLGAHRFNSVESALFLLGVQALVLLVLAGQFPLLATCEREVRTARASRTGRQLELQQVASEWALLGRSDFVVSMLRGHNEEVATAELRRDRSWRGSRRFVAAAGLLGFAVCANGPGFHNLGSRQGLVVVLVALATAELANVAGNSLRAAVAVAVSAERLDDLSIALPEGREPWPTNSMITVRSLSHSEGGRVILNHVSLSIPPQRRVAFVGPTGAGKSTLLRLLARLDDAAPRTITVAVKSLEAIEEMALRRHLSYLSAEPALLEGNVETVLRAGREQTFALAPALEQLGVGQPESGRFEHLSRGEAQRVGLVRALVNEPDVLLLDEPTAGLGASERALVLHCLSQLHATIIVATHDEELAAWCDDRYELRDGELTIISR
jgi:ATP-binding cassette subfamily C protein CydC